MPINVAILAHLLLISTVGLLTVPLLTFSEERKKYYMYSLNRHLSVKGTEIITLRVGWLAGLSLAPRG